MPDGDGGGGGDGPQGYTGYVMLGKYFFNNIQHSDVFF